MKIWNTKYALTEGVTEHDAEETETAGMVVIRSNNSPIYLHGEGRDWHRSRDVAIIRANTVRLRKIASLKAQIARLERMAF